MQNIEYKKKRNIKPSRVNKQRQRARSSTCGQQANDNPVVKGLRAQEFRGINQFESSGRKQ